MLSHDSNLSIIVCNTQKREREMTTKLSFGDWIKQEMKNRNWRDADLVKASGLASAVVSNLKNDKRNPGKITCTALSVAFKIPLAEVYQVAGMLPEDPKRDKFIDAIAYLLLDSSTEEKREALEYVQYKKSIHERNRKRSVSRIAAT